jgi:phosphonate transport system substrate-binding protein
VVSAASFLVLAQTTGAAAQEQPNPFLFLKPWLEKRFGAPNEIRPAEQPQVERSAAPQGPALSPDAGTTAAAPAAAAPDPGPADEPPSGRVRTQIEPETARGREAEGTAPDGIGAAAIDRADPGFTGAPLPIDPADIGAPGEPAAAPREEAPQPLRLAVLAGRDPSALLRTLAPVREGLAAELGRPVELLPVATWGAMIDAQVQRRIDGGFYSAAAYAVAEEECRCLDPLVAPASADGSAAFRAVIVARRASGIASPADLAGRIVATGVPDSIGARRMQLAGLMAEGYDPADFRLRSAGSAEAAVRLVLDGSADAAFAWGSFDDAPGRARGTLPAMAARGEVRLDDLAVIWRSAPVGHGPLAVSRSLPEEEKSALEDYFLDLAGMEPAAYDRLNPLYEGGYVPVEQEDYAGVAVLATQDVEAVRPSGVTPPR